MEPFPYWRNIYHTVVDQFKAVSVKYVSEILSGVEKDLVDGILLYQTYSVESYTAWKNKVQISKSGNIDKLMKDTSYAIDMDCTITYRMFCNYIMFEYYGKINDIEEAAVVDMYRKMFIQKMYQFISAERMFQLKTIQCLIQHHPEKEHKLSKYIEEFMSKFQMKLIRKKLLEQYKVLMVETCPHIDHGLSNHDCIDRNRTELLQVLITLIYTLQNEALDADEMVELLKLFNDHGFTMNIMYTRADSLSRCLEYSTLLTALMHIWESPSWPQDCAKIEKTFMEIITIVNCHSMIILCWCMMFLALPPEKIPAIYLQKLPKLILQSLNEESFKQLYQLLDNGYRKNSKLNLIINKAVYSLLKQVCKRVGNVMQIYEIEYTIDVLAKLLQIPEICDEIMADSNAVQKLFNTSINLFPYDTKSFSQLLSALISHEKYAPNVIQHVNNINVYSELLSNDMDASIVNIPQDCSKHLIGLSQNRTLVQYQGAQISYSFLASVECNFRNVVDYVSTPGRDSPRKNEEVANLTASFELLSKLIEHDRNIWQDDHFRQVLTLSKLVLSRISADVFRAPALINNILIMFCKGMPHGTKMLTSILLSSTSLPTANAHILPVHQLVKINMLNDCQLLQLLLRARSNGDYSLIYTYIKFIKECLEHQYENERFLLPGMIFIIQHVFPVHLGWREPSLHEKNTLSYDILTMLFNILHMHTLGRTKDHSFKQVYEICILTLLNNDSFVKTFLTILRYRNEFIEQVMVKEFDWELGCIREVILSVRQAVTIVLWLFNNISYEELKKSIFWQYFSYSGVNFPSVLRIICEYINHKFDPVLPKLACRLFRKISMDSSIPVLACMEIENYQIQSMFLERLRDPLEDDEMRIALLELITTCVETQNGMTAAFFNMHIKKAHGSIVPDKDEETIINYLGEYLDAIARAPETLRNPVQSTIITLFHTLWKEKRLFLINCIISQNNFWESLITSLDKNFAFRNETYFQILDILAMECYYRKSDALAKGIRDLFANKQSVDRWKKIYSLITYSIREYDESNQDVIKIQVAWKRFIILSVRNHAAIINDEVRLNLLKSNLDAFLDHLTSPQNTAIIANWLDLIMYLMTKSSLEGFDSEDDLKRIYNCCRHIEEIYGRLAQKSREAVVTVIIRSVQHFHDLFRKASSLVDDFLYVVRNIIEKEFNDVVNRQGKELRLADHMAWHLVIVLSNLMLQYDLHHKWIFFTQLLSKITSTLGFYISSCNTLPIAKLSAMFLHNMAKTSLIEEFRGIEFATFYDSLQVPKELGNYAALKHNGKNPDIYLNYWLTYLHLVNLNNLLLETLGFSMLSNVLDFIHLQRDELFQFFKLVQVTVNPIALKLIASCSNLFNQLLKWHRLVDFPSLTEYYETLPEILNSCINIIIRPNMMKFYLPYEMVNLEQMESVPLCYITNIMNKILNIIAICCKGLHLVSPSLKDLIQQEASTKQLHILQIEWNFHIPNVYYPKENNRTLTFGTLMCLVHYLTKARQLQISRKEPIKPGTIINTVGVWELQESEVSLKSEEQQLYISFLCPDYIEPVSMEPFSSIHRFTSPWLSSMDPEQTRRSLEVVNTLLASQIFQTISLPAGDCQQMQQIHVLKRDLCSELYFFHDFVRKHNVSSHYEVDGNRIVCKQKATNQEFDSGDYLMMLSHWFMDICCLTS